MNGTRRTPRPTARAWRTFSARDGQEIERQLRRGFSPCCPWCGDMLEARPTRLVDQLVLDARGYDLDCRDCRRFWSLVLHTPRSLRLLRMRRLAAAVRAVPVEPQPGAAPAPGVLVVTAA